MQQLTWSLRYSLEGFLKQLLQKTSVSVSLDSLVQQTSSEWAANDSKASSTMEDRVIAALSNPNGPFIEVEGGWRLKSDPLDELHQLARDFLSQHGAPQTHGEILRHIVALTKRSKGELMSRLDLDRYAEFARLESGEWVLSSWAIYELDIQQPSQTQQQTKDVKESNIFMDTHKDLVTLMLQELQAFEKQLADRNQEIPVEVMALFNQENIPGIEKLMVEKKRNSDFAEDLLQLTGKWLAAPAEVQEVK